MDAEITANEVREALEDLHDPVQLATHDLARRLAFSHPESEPLSRGQRLSAFLAGAIESLKPDSPMQPALPEWRRYLVLRERFVRRRSPREVEEILSLSERQVRRDLHEALDLLTSLVRSRLAAGDDRQLSSTPLLAVQRMSPVPRSIQLAPLVEGAVALLAKLDPAGGAIAWHVEPAGLSVRSDRGILHQLLIKLLQLALMRRTQSRPLSLEAVEAGGGWVHVLLSGCDANVPGDDEEGRLCHALAQSIESEIDVVDQPDGSCLVRLLLPADTRLYKVLIVDDEPLAIELFGSYLSGADYLVYGESVAEQALQRAAEVMPDVIILDVMMPGMDGWETLQQLHHLPQLQDVPIVACSILDEANLALALGAARFLRKPVFRQQLIRVLDELRGQTMSRA